MTYDDASHTYKAEDGTRIPSVTQVLQFAGCCGDPAYIKTEALARGEAVHLACEMVDTLGVDYDGEYQSYFEAYINFKAIWDFVPVAIEQAIDASVNGFRYCGRVDRIGTLDGLPCVLDIKTSKTGGTARWHKLQLAAYCWPTKIDGATVALMPTGEYKLRRFPWAGRLEEDFTEFARYLEAWYESGRAL